MCETAYICIRMRKLFALAQTEEDKDFIGDVLSDLETAETDAVYWKARFEDEWPHQGQYVRIPVPKVN